MERTLRILNLEDNLDDSELLRLHLAGAGIECEVVRVDTRDGFVDSLQSGKFDIIIADYALPTFDGMTALTISRATCPGIPFIFFTGAMGEEKAIETLKLGATDYVLKDRLNRLPSAVLHALEAAEERAKRLQAEKMLRETNSMLNTLIYAMPDQVFFKDTRGCIVLGNRAMEESLGLGQEEFIGKTNDELSPLEVASMCNKSDAEAIRRGCPTRGLEHYTDKCGETRFLDVIKAPVYDGKGDFMGLVGVSRDITDIKKAEEALEEKNLQLEDLTKNLTQRVEEEITARRQNEQMLIQQSKMAAMGEMIGAIAHQWRQPLNVLGLIVQGINDAYKFNELDPAYLDKAIYEAMRQIKHMSRTIDDFRNFFKPSKRKVPFDVVPAIKETLLLVDAQLRNSFIGVEVKVEKASLMAEGYPNEFKHVLLNLINNARDAILSAVEEKKLMKDGSGKIRVEAVKTDGAIAVTIRDNAGGIPTDLMDRIFEPYFTTKGPGKGTGIGLYMSKNIIERNMGGRLTACNWEEGAEFRVEI